MSVFAGVLRSPGALDVLIDAMCTELQTSEMRSRYTRLSTRRWGSWVLTSSSRWRMRGSRRLSHSLSAHQSKPSFVVWRDSWMPLNDWIPRRFIENEVRLNLLGLMNTYIASARQMVKQGGGGRIIGAGSIASYRTAGGDPLYVGTMRLDSSSNREPRTIWRD